MKKQIFQFQFLDGEIWRIEADVCKHYSGHAALENAEILSIQDQVGNDLDNPNRGPHERFNVGLYGLRAMFPETQSKECPF